MDYNDFDRDGHNPTVYLNAYEARMYEKFGDPEPKNNNGCWNCMLYDGNHCTKDWNNNDSCYYLPDRDDKEPSDYCSDWELDPNVVWEDFFGEEQF